MDNVSEAGGLCSTRVEKEEACEFLGVKERRNSRWLMAEWEPRLEPNPCIVINQAERAEQSRQLMQVKHGAISGGVDGIHRLQGNQLLSYSTAIDELKNIE